MEFETPDDGFVVVVYWHAAQKLSSITQKTAQKEARIKNFILSNLR